MFSDKKKNKNSKTSREKWTATQLSSLFALCFHGLDLWCLHLCMCLSIYYSLSCLKQDFSSIGLCRVPGGKILCYSPWINIEQQIGFKKRRKKQQSEDTWFLNLILYISRETTCFFPHKTRTSDFCHKVKKGTNSTKRDCLMFKSLWKQHSSDTPVLF